MTTRPRGWPGCARSSMVAPAGGSFDPASKAKKEARKAAVVDRLRQGPGPEAQQALAATPDGPPPSRWSLWAMQATFPWWEDLTVSGVWRALRQLGLGLRSAQVQQYSPDPDYLAKEAHLLACLQEAAATPDEVGALFLDEMGYTRWPD